MSQEACKGCVKKAEGTDQDPKTFCQCSKLGDIGNFGDSAVQQISRQVKDLPLPDYRDHAINKLGQLLEQHRNGDDVLTYSNLMSIYTEGKNG